MPRCRYEVYCETESAFIFTWSDTVITACPNDGAHTILSGSVRAIETIPDTLTTTCQETVTTGGSFALQVRKLSVAPHTSKNYDASWPYPVNALSLLFHTNDHAMNDTLSLVIAPSTTVGTLTADVAVDDTTFTVSSSVIENVRYGYYVSLTDGTNATEDVHICAVDPVNSTITVDVGSSHAFLASTPTLVKMSVYFFKDIELDPNRTYNIGEVTITGSHIPKNTVVRVAYTNNSAYHTVFKGTVQYTY